MTCSVRQLLLESAQWIFVGGKGGVGKTTTSCSLAVLIASQSSPTSVCGESRPRRVLLASTDPAHNLSDAFNQEIGKTPTPIHGLEQSLFAVEIDRTKLMRGEEALDFGTFEHTNIEMNGNILKMLAGVLKEATESLPGVDELAVFTEILRVSRSSSFDVVIFDTAPTGHTLQMLAMPQSLDKIVSKILSIETLSPLLSMASSAISSALTLPSADLCGNMDPTTLDSESLIDALKTWHSQIIQIHKQFVDHTRTTFICVCIPEFLSVYETERLIQELMKYDIACSTIVVNQTVLRPTDAPPCFMCHARQKVQSKYLAQIESLYDDFDIIKMPLMGDEVRGVDALQQFSKFLLEPYNPDIHGYITLEHSD